MTIRFTCPNCGIQTDVADQYAGKSGPCAACGQTISVPMIATATAAQNSNRMPVVVTALVIGAALLFGMMIIGMLVALLLPAVSAARSAASRVACMNNTRQIAQAMRAYHEDYGNYPPAYSTDENGRPMHSWRVLILPYLGPDAIALHDRFDLNQPWDHPTNRQFASSMPAVYGCPADSAAAMGETSYCVVEGPGFMFDADRTTSDGDLNNRAAQTLMLVEARGSAIEWIEPKDINAASLAQGINSGMSGCCGSAHPGGIVVAYADGAVVFLPDVTSPEELNDMATVSRGKAEPE